MNVTSLRNEGAALELVAISYGSFKGSEDTPNYITWESDQFFLSLFILGPVNMKIASWKSWTELWSSDRACVPSFIGCLS